MFPKTLDFVGGVAQCDKALACNYEHTSLMPPWTSRCGGLRKSRLTVEIWWATGSSRLLATPKHVSKLKSFS